MNTFLVISILAFAVGIWIGVGAPGWPYKPDPSRPRLKKRPINPIAWGRTSDRDRAQPRTVGERRIKLR